MANACKCRKCDRHGEVSCEHAQFDMMIKSAVCTHSCVIELVQQLQNEVTKRKEAESKLKQYREAVQPFLGDCRKILDMAASFEKGVI
jgi:hypothetical protein